MPTLKLDNLDRDRSSKTARALFAGKVQGGMKLSPCGGYMVYPLGSILVVRSMAGKNKQAFLEGHTADISCVAISADGTRIVSGQVQ